MEGRVCVLTGASRGIGRETARRLLEMGATVVMVCRTRESGEAALRWVRDRTRAGVAELLIADLSSMDAVRRLAEEALARFPRIDVLLNNAGVLMLRRTLTVDRFETTFAVNHLAPFLLTNLLVEGLTAAAPSRVVTVASIAHQAGRIAFEDLMGERGYLGAAAYSQSKLANILFSNELARRLAGRGVTSNALHPGAIPGTGLYRRSLVYQLPAWLGTPFFPSVQRGARTSVHLAASTEVEGVTGGYFARSRPARPAPQAMDESAARRLWEVSAQLTSLSPSL